LVLQHSSIDELVEAMAERKVDRLSYSGLTDLDGFVRETLGFALFDNDEDRKAAVVAVERRNLIVHKRGVADARYIARSGDDSVRPGERVNLYGDLAMDTLELLSRLASETDRRAAEKWNIPQPVSAKDVWIPPP
jgi:hypothetical protein